MWNLEEVVSSAPVAAESVESAGTVSATESLAAITVSRPSASAATKTITTPSPLKKPICSTAIRAAPPTGAPAPGSVVQCAATTVPTANHAPASAASHAPNTATGRSRLISTTMPLTSATAPGSTSSHIRPAVTAQVWSGV